MGRGTVGLLLYENVGSRGAVFPLPTCVGRRNGSKCTRPSAGTERGATRPVHDSGRCQEKGPVLGTVVGGSSLFAPASSRARLRSPDGAAAEEAEEEEEAEEVAEGSSERLIKPGAMDAMADECQLLSTVEREFYGCTGEGRGGEGRGGGE